MSATYNWAYRPAVTNKYGFTVPAGADNVRPTGWCYVALFGNDTSGNGSRQYPYRTLTKVFSLGLALNVVISSGVYREASPYLGTLHDFTLIGDGDVVIDISYNSSLSTNGLQVFKAYNLKFKGNGTSAITALGSQNSNGNSYTDIFFDACGISAGGGVQVCAVITNCVITNYNAPFDLGSNSDGPTGLTNCTFYNCNNLRFTQSTNVSTTPFTSCIFYSCNISAATVQFLGTIRYSLFFQCNFKMTTGLSNGGVLYPSVPGGYTYYSTITALQAAYTALFSALSFTGCTISDPLFNNLVIGDFTLSFSSPAKNLSFFGTYAGAKSIAYPIKVSATESLGNFDFSTNVNLTIANDSITLIDITQTGSIKTKMIINTAGRQIQKFPIYGFNADRNGQYIDSIADMDTVVKNAGDAVAAGLPYLVEGAAITCNSVVYQPGDKLVIPTGISVFSGTGTLREILEAPQRHTIMARFSDGGATVNAGDALIIDNWYYVFAGSITYNSVVYNAGIGFKAIDTNSFSGSGTVIVALSTEAFQHYEPGIQPTSNNTGNTRTGAIIRGNGDPAYIRGGYGIQEFPINAKFIQLYYIINVLNLKP